METEAFTALAPRALSTEQITAMLAKASSRGHGKGLALVKALTAVVKDSHPLLTASPSTAPNVHLLHRPPRFSDGLFSDRSSACSSECTGSSSSLSGGDAQMLSPAHRARVALRRRQRPLTWACLVCHKVNSTADPACAVCGRLHGHAPGDAALPMIPIADESWVSSTDGSDDEALQARDDAAARDAEVRRDPPVWQCVKCWQVNNARDDQCRSCDYGIRPDEHRRVNGVLGRWAWRCHICAQANVWDKTECQTCGWNFPFRERRISRRHRGRRRRRRRHRTPRDPSSASANARPPSGPLAIRRWASSGCESSPRGNQGKGSVLRKEGWSMDAPQPPQVSFGGRSADPRGMGRSVSGGDEASQSSASSVSGDSVSGSGGSSDGDDEDQALSRAGRRWANKSAATESWTCGVCSNVNPHVYVDCFHCGRPENPGSNAASRCLNHDARLHSKRLDVVPRSAAATHDHTATAELLADEGRADVRTSGTAPGDGVGGVGGVQRTLRAVADRRWKCVACTKTNRMGGVDLTCAYCGKLHHRHFGDQRRQYGEHALARNKATQHGTPTVHAPTEGIMHAEDGVPMIWNPEKEKYVKLTSAGSMRHLGKAQDSLMDAVNRLSTTSK